ncbi:KilA-N domain-containing protein [Erwinia sp. Leaf53]|uniref:KilA-N domain-containing protein n=1 Tax=Erwinia sp. Leaf53 TaxID=1736225 RepID=UPI0006FA4E89|nr:KilA-N domain-containing protein [Erwinia sp. Leaf53]KQN56742.1 DNA-binding protein [Erwinia sp. Leaf53]
MNQLLVIDGVSVRQDKAGRYCLNDLHRAAGGETRHKPAFWLRNEQIEQLVTELQKSNSLPVEVIRGGNQQGTYVCKELVYAYGMWISPAFHLKVIRTFDAIVTGHANHSAHDMMQAGVTLLGFMRKELNLSNSSVLGACQKLQTAVGLPNLAPQYAIDAPDGAVDGSSRPTSSLTTLLRESEFAVNTNEAYRRLQQLGIVERLSRPSNSSRALNGRKEFWSITAKGLRYGKNMTSPGNPRETQPHFYTSTKAELIRLMMVSTKGAR